MKALKFVFIPDVFKKKIATVIYLHLSVGLRNKKLIWVLLKQPFKNKMNFETYSCLMLSA